MERTGVVKASRQGIMDELLQMKRRMDTLYSESVKSVRHASAEAPEALWVPPTDVWETEEEWTAVLDLPGVDQSDLKVQIKGEVLTVSGRRNSRRRPFEAKAIQSERPQGFFKTRLIVPADAASDKVDAELCQGILTIRIPKISQNHKKITVGSA
jgi:HSP20 family protein